MAYPIVEKSLFKFLKDLDKNNNRPWFNENKDRYLVAQQSMKAFTETLVNEMSYHDNIEGIRLHRIYRDVRFSKDKTPYKARFSGGMKRATKWLRGGYYFHIQPGNSLLAGGFWGPNSPDLKRIRQEIAADAKPLRKIIKAAKFKKYFGELQGDQVKTAPKGYAKDHPNIDLLRYKQFLLIHPFTDEEVQQKNFMKELVKGYKNMRPFFDYMSEVLTTDSNGVPID
ncbi:MAG: DUF2461 domain-containing protein [Bacteroidota bacterium]